MKSMKILCCVTLLAICSTTTYSQVKFGATVFYGIGGVKNLGSIQKYYDLKKSQDSDILARDITNKQGSVFGIGGIISYQINEMFSLNSGLRFQKQNNDIEIYQKEIEDTDGSYRENNSVTTISISSLIIPITAKVRFGENSFKPFINGGLSFESRLSKTIDSDETRTDWGGTDEEFDYTNYTFSDKPLEGFNSTTLNFIVGAGVDYELDKGQVLFLAVNYTSNLSESELWSKNLNSNSISVGDNNRIFDQSDQKTIESSEGIKIDDWKSSSLTFSVGILF